MNLPAGIARGRVAASQALLTWRQSSKKALDEIEAAHKAVGGTGRGRRYATQQVNQAYAVLLSSQFQLFCRNLHTECVDILTTDPAHARINPVLKTRMTEGRKLDTGNPNRGNIGADFNRFLFPTNFWDVVAAIVPKPTLDLHEELALWRNAIAHQDFSKIDQGKKLVLTRIRSWRRTCNELAEAFNTVMFDQMTTIMGCSPW